MTIRALLAVQPYHVSDTFDAIAAACADAGLDVDLATDHVPDTVDYIITAPNGPVQDFTPYTRCRAVLNLWAGVEGIVGNPTLTQPLARMIETGLTDGMREWVAGHVLRIHLGMDAHIHGQDGIWRKPVPPLAKDRQITVLGLGELGTTCARTLSTLGFPVTGWSRNAKSIDGITCLSGADGLAKALKDAQIVVLLLPLTDATTHIIDRETLAQLTKGASVINPGRGGLIDDGALLAALDSGHIGHAVLDVFTTEPLPARHPYWAHPSVLVTPHIASATRSDTAAASIADNIKRCETDQPLVGLVDRTAGY